MAKQNVTADEKLKTIMQPEEQNLGKIVITRKQPHDRKSENTIIC